MVGFLLKGECQSQELRFRPLFTEKAYPEPALWVSRISLLHSAAYGIPGALSTISSLRFNSIFECFGNAPSGTVIIGAPIPAAHEDERNVGSTIASRFHFSSAIRSPL